MIQDSNWWLFAALMPLIYWRLPIGWRPLALSLASFTVLIVLEPFDLLLMLALALFVHAATTTSIATVEGASGDGRTGLPAWLAGSRRFSLPVVAILAYLFWYKYYLPYADILRYGPSFVSFAIPLGISYFSFKLLHYALERRRGMLPAHGLWDFLSWLFLMPIFSSGPIERFEHYVEHRATRFEASFVVEGGMRIAQGLIKKFVFLPWIVDGSFNLVGEDWVGFAHGAGGLHGAAQTWAYLALTLINSYLDFSAYSDIAIGVSRLFGLKIMENFDWPMLATNLVDFWRRYHMSLTNWTRTYIFMPMLGYTRNPYLAMLVSFVVIGVWHAGWLNWLFWGLWHGLGQIAAIRWGRFAQKRRITFFKKTHGKVVGWALTMAYVMLGGAFETVHGQATIWDALCMIGRAFGV